MLSNVVFKEINLLELRKITRIPVKSIFRWFYERDNIFCITENLVSLLVFKKNMLFVSTLWLRHCQYFVNLFEFNFALLFVA